MLCSLFFQKNDFITKLRDVSGAISKRPDRSSDVIIEMLMKIKDLQNLRVEKECKINILQRGLKNNTIISRDLNVNAMISSLLKDPSCSRDDVLALQHRTYHSLMSIEMTNLKRELTKISSISAKERRILKVISSDDVFKVCIDFLSFQNASETILVGKKNEALWKVALEEKDAQVKSIDCWLKAVSKVDAEYQYDPVIDNSTNLSISVNEIIDIPPAPLSHRSIVDEFSKPFMSDAIRRDDDAVDIPGMRKSKVNALEVSKILSDEPEDIYLDEVTGSVEHGNGRSDTEKVVRDVVSVTNDGKENVPKDEGMRKFVNPKSIKGLKNEKCKSERDKPYAKDRKLERGRSVKEKLVRGKREGGKERPVALMNVNFRGQGGSDSINHNNRPLNNGIGCDRRRYSDYKFKSDNYHNCDGNGTPDQRRYGYNGFRNDQRSDDNFDSHRDNFNWNE